MTVTRVARQFCLSRTALLYYERIGLLSASTRSATGYRVYSKGDIDRLREICRLREAGLSLRAVGRALGSDDCLPDLLRSRLKELEEEIATRRAQQRVIVGLLNVDATNLDVGPMSKARWTALLEAAGFSEEDMMRWHADFERTAPRAHQAFLEVLMVPDDEIARIRDRSRNSASGGGRATSRVIRGALARASSGLSPSRAGDGVHVSPKAPRRS